MRSCTGRGTPPRPAGVVADVAQAHGVDEVVKVKSMATQEIGLNEALAAEGIAAWETDLAELIVQLADDLPSHILVPAIHRNRAEVRDIFRTRMARPVGRRPTISPTTRPSSPNAARLHLREKFLRAKVAVSGANFAVAETGTLVVVESEGNGRMCLTLPEVLVTVVGIEKVVPTFADLDVFLRLLPRSSTGERMNPYTSMWTGVTPGDGPQEVHVVLLDNGRTRALADEVGPAGAALHPVLGVPQRLPGLRARRRPRLRLGLPRADRRDPHPAAARASGVDEQTDSLPYASTLCGACYEVCPVKIDIPSILVDLRAQVVDAHRGGRPEGGGAGDEGRGLGVHRRPPARRRRAPLRPGRPGLGPGRAYVAPRRPPRARPSARAGAALDRCPRPAGSAARVVPGLVDAYPGTGDPP